MFSYKILPAALALFLLEAIPLSSAKCTSFIPLRSEVFTTQQFPQITKFFGVPLEMLECPASTTSKVPCRFERKTYSIFVPVQISYSLNNMTASALSVGGNATRPGLVNGRELVNLTGAINSTFTDLQSLTLFAQNVWSLPQSQLKPITFQSLAATVSTLSLSPNASILEVAPGAAKTLYWLPSLLSASGEPVGCDNSSLNGLPGTRITSPYLERDGSIAGGLDFRNEGKVVSGGPTVTSSTSMMATSATATPTANVEAKKSLGVAKGVDRVNCALVAMGVLCMGAFML